MKLGGPLSIIGLTVFCIVSLAAAPARAELEIEEVAPGIYTGVAPQSEEDYAKLRGLHVRTIVNMRKFRPLASHHQQRVVERNGMRYRHIPVGFFPTRDGAPDRVLDILADPGTHPVYIHCQLGRDRTGLVVALYRVHYLGWDPQQAHAAMESQQFNPLLRDLDRYFWQRVATATCD